MNPGLWVTFGITSDKLVNSHTRRQGGCGVSLDRPQNELGTLTRAGLNREHGHREPTAPSVRASSPFKPHIREVADAGRVRVVANAEHGDINEVPRRVSC